ncbi:uncharacterized protein F5147DRAFT_756564 [Suillus discolor]|uniref:Uncharacterized protein n=1 Tax=Suillus discolor TaxID=1912936 RepID=A0A9P7FMB3_9AGAM|nr:uncharacterized protein F5147DRAFT_756564 [Suillus discolor]KAG2120571.1 hypothetical protein F5147DRAFT_756564 [Suillus discolor]
MRFSSAIQVVLAVITALTSISATPAQNPAGAEICDVYCLINKDCTSACSRDFSLCLNNACYIKRDGMKSWQDLLVIVLQNPAGAEICDVFCVTDEDCTKACPDYLLCFDASCHWGHDA